MGLELTSAPPNSQLSSLFTSIPCFPVGRIQTAWRNRSLAQALASRGTIFKDSRCPRVKLIEYAVLHPILCRVRLDCIGGRCTTSAIEIAGERGPVVTSCVVGAHGPRRPTSTLPHLTCYTGNMGDKHRHPRWIWPQVPARVTVVRDFRMEEGASARGHPEPGTSRVETYGTSCHVTYSNSDNVSNIRFHLHLSMTSNHLCQ